MENNNSPHYESNNDDGVEGKSDFGDEGGVLPLYRGVGDDGGGGKVDGEEGAAVTEQFCLALIW